MTLPQDDTLREILGALTGFDTTSRRGNLALIEWVENYLKKYGITSLRLPGTREDKATLVASVGPRAPGGIVLSGHTDTVPVENQPWTVPPHVLTERNEKWLGRGVTDMKGFLACCLAMVPHFVQSPLKYPVHLCFTHDEEIGCLSAPALAAHIHAAEWKPSLAIIGEPTLMQVVTAHKGIVSFETHIYGREGHSSNPAGGVNALYYGAQWVNMLASMAAALAARETDARFAPAQATLHVGTLHAGTARNIIPAECHAEWEIRFLPGKNIDPLLAEIENARAKLETRMLAQHPECRIVNHIHHRVAALDNRAHASAMTLALHFAERNASEAVAFATEAGALSEAGIPVVVCGPGSIAQAHIADEWIDPAELSRCMAMLKRVAQYCAG